MELHCQLDAESVRRLALRLFGEQALKADPAGVVFATVSWIDRVLDNSEPPLPVQNPVIQSLISLVKADGVATVAERLKVGTTTLRNWVSGSVPSKLNLEKIEAFLRDSQALVSEAAGTAVEPLKPGELFQPQLSQQQQPEPESKSDKQPAT